MTTGWSSLWTAGRTARTRYITAKTFVHTVKTTNDLAERAIKMATDYSQILTEDEDTRRRIIQGVEDHRRAYPDFKKSTFNH